MPKSPVMESTKLSLSRIAEMDKFPGFGDWVPTLAPNDLFLVLVENDKLVKLVSQGCLMTPELVVRINRFHGKVHYFKEASSVDVGVGAGRAIRFFERSYSRDQELEPMPNEISAKVRDVFMHYYKGNKLEKRKFFLGMALGLECIPAEEFYDESTIEDKDKHAIALSFASEAVAAIVINGVIEKTHLVKIFRQVYGKYTAKEIPDVMVSLIGSTKDLQIAEEFASELWGWNQNVEFSLAKKRFEEWSFDVAA